jgi:hypothetical protein
LEGKHQLTWKSNLHCIGFAPAGTGYFPFTFEVARLPDGEPNHIAGIVLLQSLLLIHITGAESSFFALSLFLGGINL